MTDTLKSLGQALPSSLTLTSLYVVPGATSAAVSSVVLCNTGTVAACVRLSHAIAGAADALQQYLLYDHPLAPSETFVATIGPSLATTDVIRCYSDTGTVAFNLYGVEVT